MGFSVKTFYNADTCATSNQTLFKYPEKRTQYDGWNYGFYLNGLAGLLIGGLWSDYDERQTASILGCFSYYLIVLLILF